MKTKNVLVTDGHNGGFVTLVDWYGSDQRVVDAARVSISGEGVKATTKNKALIRYLMRHRHTTPFEMVDFTFHVKAPIFVARQWMRHRTFSYNEMSGRYSELPEDFYVPPVERMVKQSKTNNQGSADELIENPGAWSDGYYYEAQELFEIYRARLQEDLTREVARVNLPVSTYTEFYAKGNLHNWLHFLSLRDDPHAQYEIRVYAEAIGEMIKDCVPLSYEAYEDYRKDGMFLTADDVKAIKTMMRYDDWDGRDEQPSLEFKTKRERNEFFKKWDKIIE